MQGATATGEVRTACPRTRYDACGVLVLRRAGRPDDRAWRPGRPCQPGKALQECSSAYNGVMVDSSSRLSQPLRRAGAKGKGSFDPVSWDDAIAEIVELRLGSISR